MHLSTLQESGRQVEADSTSSIVRRLKRRLTLGAWLYRRDPGFVFGLRRCCCCHSALPGGGGGGGFFSGGGFGFGFSASVWPVQTIDTQLSCGYPVLTAARCACRVT